MIKKIIYIFLFTFILLDIGYSFIQHYKTPIGGDIEESLIPSPHFDKIFNSPFGLKAIINQEHYPNPNRFFMQWPFKEFMLRMPLFLQQFTNPINSIYLSSAIGKITIQIILIFLLTFIITKTYKIFTLKFIITASLIIPLFQTNGYRIYMGIIDPSITYTFSYAFSSILAILYFLPFITIYYHKKNIPFQSIIPFFWIPFGAITCLSGPLNPGIILVFSFIIFFKKTVHILIQSKEKGIQRNIKKIIFDIPNGYWIYLIPICLFALYSLYLGQYNSHRNIYPYSLTNLYLNLPKGIYNQFTQKLGFPILFLILTINTIIIKKKCTQVQYNKILKSYKWIGLFSVLYILLLPLGGYRDYRPNILRYDTILPITLSLIFLFGTTTTLIINTILNQRKSWYIVLITCIMIIFTYTDKPKFDKNTCEKTSLNEIAVSAEDIVKLDLNCPIISWDLIKTLQESEVKSELLLKWNIIHHKKLFYHKE